MTNKTQSDKFKEAARELECDDDPSLFEKTVKKLAKSKETAKEPQ